MRKFTNFSKRYLTIFLILSGTFLAHAQVKVSGVVKDANNSEGLPGVNVIISGTTTGTVTDIEGKYSLEVPGSDVVLKFSSIGYLEQEVTVGNRATLDIVLEADVKQLE